MRARLKSPFLGKEQFPRCRGEAGDKRAGKVADVIFEPVSGPHPAFSLVLHTGVCLADNLVNVKRTVLTVRNSDGLRFATDVIKQSD